MRYTNIKAKKKNQKKQVSSVSTQKLHVIWYVKYHQEIRTKSTFLKSVLLLKILLPNTTNKNLYSSKKFP